MLNQKHGKRRKCCLPAVYTLLKFSENEMQGVQSRRNVCESRRFMKNCVQIYVPKRPRTYEKHLLNLLEPSISEIFTSTLTIFSVKSLEKLCQTMSWRLLKTQLCIVSFSYDVFKRLNS